jgi:small subunit ribosomal protein S20
MPHTKSAAKNLRKSDKRRSYNRNVKRDVKLQLKSFETAVSAKGDTQAELKAAYQKLDKAAARGVIHPNTAARKKSQLAKAASKAKA